MSNQLSQTILNTIDLVAARWSQANTNILRNVFPLLAKGQPVTVTSIASACGEYQETIKETLRLGQAQCDQYGRVVGLSGFGLGPTRHRIEIDGVVLYGCCAMFSLMIPSLVAQEVKIESVDPITRQLVRLKVRPDGFVRADPANAAGSMVTADQEALNRDIGAAFCSHINYFVSPESAQKFVKGIDNRQTATIDELVCGARYLVNRVWDK